MNKKFIANLVGRIWGSNLSEKLNTHNEECLVKNLDQNTRGIRPIKSQTERNLENFGRR